MEYKEIYTQDQGLDTEDIVMGNTAKEQAQAAAKKFNGTMYSDGMMVMPPEWERMGITTATSGMTRPVTAWSESQVHVFVENGQAVVMQGSHTAVFGGAVGEQHTADDSVPVARKAACV